MRRVSVLVVSLATAACTVMSGVDDMELRTGTSSTSPPPPSAGGPSKSDSDHSPDASADGETNSSGGNTSGGSTSGAVPIATGPATCGAQGSWTACEATPSLDTCLMRCLQQGLTCVDSCCAYDTVGDYAAQVGMFYAVVPAAECSLKSVNASGKGGLCTDPTILTAGGAAEVRCCCK